MTCPWTPKRRGRLRVAVSRSRVPGGIPLKAAEALTPSQAVGAAREMLAAFLPRLGSAGATAAVMARSPILDRRTRVLISVALHARQACLTCLAFHEEAARSAGANEHHITAARTGSSPDPAIGAMIDVALNLHTSSATINGAQIAALKRHGYSSREIADAVLVVATTVIACALGTKPPTPSPDPLSDNNIPFVP